MTLETEEDWELGWELNMIRGGQTKEGLITRGENRRRRRRRKGWKWGFNCITLWQLHLHHFVGECVSLCLLEINTECVYVCVSITPTGPLLCQCSAIISLYLSPDPSPPLSLPCHYHSPHSPIPLSLSSIFHSRHTHSSHFAQIHTHTNTDSVD